MPENHTFYQRFWPLYLMILVVTLPFAIIGAAVDLGIMEHPFKTTVLLTFTLALAAILTTVASRGKIIVSPDGIRGYDISGISKFTSWKDIDRVRPTRVVLGLPYLRLELKENQGTIWLPLLLRNLPHFVTLVADYAGSNHLLVATMKNYTDFK